MEKPILSNNVLSGPWQVVLSRPGYWRHWYIYNTQSGRYVQIGPIGAKKTNYFERAFVEAERRNQKEIARCGTLP